MGKYDRLTEFLRNSAVDEIILTHKQIEIVIGSTLPESSKSHVAWWSNDRTPHSQSGAWLDAGFEVESPTNAKDGTITFVREKKLNENLYEME